MDATDATRTRAGMHDHFESPSHPQLPQLLSAMTNDIQTAVSLLTTKYPGTYQARAWHLARAQQQQHATPHQMSCQRQRQILTK